MRRISAWSLMFIIASVLFVGSPQAAVLTFSQPDILKFEFLTGSSSPSLPAGLFTDLFVLSPPVSGINPHKGIFWETEPSYTLLPSSPLGVYFEGWASELWIGATASSLGLTNGSTFDGFELDVTNWNNQVWNFSSFIYDDAGTLYESTPPVGLNPRPISTSPGDTGRLSLPWPAGYAVSGNDIFGVHVVLPSGGIDKAHFEVKPIPEPATLILVGSGLIGLAGWGRRRRLRR